MGGPAAALNRPRQLALDLEREKAVGTPASTFPSEAPAVRLRAPAARRFQLLLDPDSRASTSPTNSLLSYVLMMRRAAWWPAGTPPGTTRRRCPRRADVRGAARRVRADPTQVGTPKACAGVGIGLPPRQAPKSGRAGARHHESARQARAADRRGTRRQARRRARANAASRRRSARVRRLAELAARAPPLPHLLADQPTPHRATRSGRHARRRL